MAQSNLSSLWSWPFFKQGPRPEDLQRPVPVLTRPRLWEHQLCFCSDVDIPFQKFPSPISSTMSPSDLNSHSHETEDRRKHSWKYDLYHLPFVTSLQAFPFPVNIVILPIFYLCGTNRSSRQCCTMKTHSYANTQPCLWMPKSTSACCLLCHLRKWINLTPFLNCPYARGMDAQWGQKAALLLLFLQKKKKV